MPSLRVSTLPLSAPGVPQPAYDRERVRTGIVHLGVSGAPRSHQAMYMDRVLHAGHDA